MELTILLSDVERYILDIPDKLNVVELNGLTEKLNSVLKIANKNFNPINKPTLENLNHFKRQFGKNAKFTPEFMTEFLKVSEGLNYRLFEEKKPVLEEIYKKHGLSFNLTNNNSISQLSYAFKQRLKKLNSLTPTA